MAESTEDEDTDEPDEGDGDGDDPVAEQIAKGSVRLEVVSDPDQLALATRSTRLAAGMFMGTLLGLPQIIDAATGHAAFEATMVRLLMLLAVSVGASLGLGSLFDSLTHKASSPDATPPPVAAMTDDPDPSEREA
ncbi:MAG: hypothetical protein GY713_09120 [Actinomycetia bacterium]|nr:hypothetical protein [Actinomycetes bacterium]